MDVFKGLMQNTVCLKPVLEKFQIVFRTTRLKYIFIMQSIVFCNLEPFTSTQNVRIIHERLPGLAKWQVIRLQSYNGKLICRSLFLVDWQKCFVYL